MINAGREESSYVGTLEKCYLNNTTASNVVVACIHVDIDITAPGTMLSCYVEGWGKLLSFEPLDRGIERCVSRRVRTALGFASLGRNRGDLVVSHDRVTIVSAIAVVRFGSGLGRICSHHVTLPLSSLLCPRILLA
jgi:hypothetical protein